MLATLQLENLVVVSVTAVNFQRAVLLQFFLIQLYFQSLAEWVEKVKLAGSAETAMQAKWLPGCRR